MYRYFNPNPKNNSANDCVIRALCGLFHLSWDEAYDMLCDEGRRVKEVPTTNWVWEGLLERAGLVRTYMRCATNCPNIKQFLEINNEGAYILCTGTHVIYAMNGDYYDAWDSGDQRLQYFYT